MEDENERVKNPPPRIYVSEAEYFSICKELLAKIRESKERFDYIIAIARGGLYVGTFLSYRLSIPMYVVYAKSYKGMYRGDVTLWIPDLHVKRKKILLVDDVVD